MTRRWQITQSRLNCSTGNRISPWLFKIYFISQLINMIYGAGRLWLKVQRDRSHSPSLKEILSGAFCCACMESACSCKFRQLCIEVPDLPSHWEVKSSHPGLTVKTWGLNFWPPTVESAGVYQGRGTAQTGSSLTGRTGLAVQLFHGGISLCCRELWTCQPEVRGAS